MRRLRLAFAVLLIVLGGTGCSSPQEGQDRVRTPRVQSTTEPPSWFENVAIGAYWGSPNSRTVVLLVGTDPGVRTGVISYQNAASTTSIGAHIDLQWHRVLSGHSASIWFQSTSDQEDFVWAANNARVNDYVCFYGVATADRECDHVMLLNTCYQPGDLEFCGLAMTRTSHAQPGDSGGPWYINQNAAGYTSGRKYIFDALHDLFTPGTRVPENLNGRILNYAAGD